MTDPRSMREFLESGPIAPGRMRAVERNAIELGLSSLQMMEAAGQALAERVLEGSPSRILVLAGRGNNGGDGMAAARHLQRDADVTVIYHASSGMSEEAAAQLRLLRQSSVALCPVACRDDVLPLEPLFTGAEAIVDALLGIGAKGDLKEPIRTCVELANRSGRSIVAVDIPTPGIRSSRIVAFHRAKVEGSEVVGIGIPIEAECTVGPGDIALVPVRPQNAHKGMGGKLVVIGGGPYQGAPILSGLGAMRAGADVVRIVSTVPQPYLDLIHVPLEGTHLVEGHVEEITRWVEWADAVVIGPGLGEQSHPVVQAIAPCCKAVVYDADALRQPLPQSTNAVYTPHAGEFARITGRRPPEELLPRARAVRDAGIPGVVLLKGPVDVISDGSRVRFNRTGSPAMAVAGTGDILAGVTGALLCRLPPFEAACVAAYVNGHAGMAASEARGDGMLASEMLDEIPRQLWRSG